MPVEKVQLGVSAIKELLDNGYTWLKKDDLGFGSIQEKYQASEVQINTIRKHPALKDLETTARIFVIIDDTKENETPVLKLDEPIFESVTPMADLRPEMASSDDSFSAFNSL